MYMALFRCASLIACLTSRPLNEIFRLLQPQRSYIRSCWSRSKRLRKIHILSLTETPCQHSHGNPLANPFANIQRLTHFPVTAFALLRSIPFFRRLKALEFHKQLNSALVRVVPNILGLRTLDISKLIGGSFILLIHAK